MPAIYVLAKNSNHNISCQHVIPVIRFWKTIGVSGGILYLSLMRESRLHVPTFTGADKSAHFLMYVVLGAVWIWELLQTYNIKNKRWFWACLYPILYGGMIELLQEYYFPPRTGDWVDWIADIGGTVVGVCITGIIWKRRHSVIQ